MSSLAKAVHDYLALRRGLGFKLVRHEAQLQEFMSFLARKHSSRITVALALEWATLHAREKPADWAARLSVVRGFARHWSATDPSTEVPPLGLLPYSGGTRATVFLFRARNPAVTDGRQGSTVQGSAALLDLLLSIRIAGRYGPAIGGGIEPPD